MRPISLLALLLGAVMIVACSSKAASSPRTPKQDDKSEEKDDTEEEEEDSQESRVTPTPSTEDRNPETTTPETPAKPAFPRAVATGECPKGDGLYCAGHGVEGGTTATLYRCKEGQITEEKKCATACIYLATGGADACDGDGTKCPRGSGLYCGTNYFSADPKALLRCTAGAVTVEQACATSCVKEADGTPDRCE